MDIKVYAHASYVGTTGYNNHTRDFFRRLSKHTDLKVRNFTVGNSWEGISDEPHNGESYLNDVDKKLLHEQTLWSDNHNRSDYPIYTNHKNDFEHNVNLILEETNHHYFYDGYVGPKIAYNVWESTEQPQNFFNQLLQFDQIWVPSQWQADCTIKQGADPNKVKVVPEGVDTETFYPEDFETTLDYSDGRFKFVIFGRWDYRKSTKEMIETFLKTFDPSEPVDLILSIDNPWGEPLDGCKTTEERLEKFGISDPRLKIKHFPSREDYITYLKNGHVFLSCARAEGWNLPLIEAMACGTPSIYSACSAQMQFAGGKGLPVKIVGEKSTQGNNYSNFAINLEDTYIPGNYYEPDFEDLSRVMRDAYENYETHKVKALEEAKIIHQDFNWDNVARIGKNTLQEFMDNYVPTVRPNVIEVSYLEGPKVEVKGDESKEYFIEFIDGDTDEVIYSDTIRNNMWTTCSRKYYTKWVIKVNNRIVDTLNLENETVLIALESRSLGDTIAWTPYAVEFAKKHNCKVVLSTFHNDWFKGLEAYKDIQFMEPGQSTPCAAVYRIGWFKGDDNKWSRFDKNPNQVNTIPLQQTATDILGLEYKELNYGLTFKKGKRLIQGKYVVIGPQATAGCKEWSRNHWITLTTLLNQAGYQVVALTKDKSDLPNVINSWNQSFETTANYLYHADLFIGLGSGLSWFNWALGKHTVMINGFVDKNHEFQSKVTRIMNEGSCVPCWTNPNFVFDPGDWNWCPIYKGTDKQFICQKSITPGQVFQKIKPILNSKK
jgi:autotransporter strand-loop-strand O-heptosyltransferase